MQDASFKVYLFSYHHDGARWRFEIPAKDPQDAKDRVAKLVYATYDGELIARLPAACGPIARLVTWARNSIRVLFPTGPGTTKAG